MLEVNFLAISIGRQKAKNEGKTRRKKTTFKPPFHSQCDQIVPSVYGLTLEAWDIE
jgi:hypothetical protein